MEILAQLKHTRVNMPLKFNEWHNIHVVRVQLIGLHILVTDFSQ